MKQSRLMSFLETALSTLIGLGVALGTQIVVFPFFGFNPPLSTNLAITAIFTLVSIARQFVVRRLFEALHIRRPLSPFMQAVIAERYRQIEAEGWSHSHDDDHVIGHLASAGAAYAIGANATAHNVKGTQPPAAWPWDVEWWKPAGFRRDLVKAAALIAAEGERFDRSRKSSSLVTDERRKDRSRLGDLKPEHSK